MASKICLEAIGGLGSVAGLIQQSFQLLDRVKDALERQKNNSMYLTPVLADVKDTQNVVKQVQDNPRLQSETLESVASQLLQTATKLHDLVTEQEADSKKGGGFRQFAHQFANGPSEQHKLEALRTSLVNSKNTLVLAIVAQLAPPGTILTVSDSTFKGNSWIQNSRIIRGPDDKDFDTIAIKGVDMADRAIMMNSSLTPDELQKLNQDYGQRCQMQDKTTLEQDKTIRIKEFTALMLNAGLDADERKSILNLIKECQASGR